MPSVIDALPANIPDLQTLVEALNEDINEINANFQQQTSSQNGQINSPNQGVDTGQFEGNAFSYTNPNTNVYDFLDPLFQAIRTAQTLVSQAEVQVNAIGNQQIQLGAVTASSIAAGTIVAGNIAAGTITGTQIAATTITATNLNVSILSAITANLGTITAGNITLDSSGFIRGGQTGYNTGAGFWMGFNSGAYEFSIGNGSTNYLNWNGSNILSQGGSGANMVIIDTTGFTVGTPSAQRIFMGTTNSRPASLSFFNSSNVFVAGISQFSGGSEILQLGGAGTNTVTLQNTDTTFSTLLMLNGTTFNSATLTNDFTGSITGPGLELLGTGGATGTAFYMANQIQMQGGSGLSPFIVSNPYDGILQIGVQPVGAPYMLSLRKQRGSDNNAGIIFANDFWANSVNVGMAAINAVDSASSGGELHLQTTRNGGGSSGTPADSVVVLNDATVKIINNGGTPGTPSGGGYLYVSSGALVYKGSSGTTTTIANA